MKKVITLLFVFGLILGTSVNSYAQTIGANVEIDEVGSPPNTTVKVPVYANFNMGEIVRSFEFHLNYDPNVLEFEGISNINSIFSADLDWAHEPTGFAKINSDVYLKIWWTITEDDAEEFDGVLFDLEFSYNGGESDIIFVGKNETGVSEVGGGTANGDNDPGKQIEIADRIDTDFEDGKVFEIDEPVIPLANWPVFADMFLMLGFIAFRFVRL